MRICMIDVHCLIILLMFKAWKNMFFDLCPYKLVTLVLYLFRYPLFEYFVVLLLFLKLSHSWLLFNVVLGFIAV